MLKQAVVCVQVPQWNANPGIQHPGDPEAVSQALPKPQARRFCRKGHFARAPGGPIESKYLRGVLRLCRTAAAHRVPEVGCSSSPNHVCGQMV